MCYCVLKHYENEGDDFLRCVFNGDDRWFHYCSPQSKAPKCGMEISVQNAMNGERNYVHTGFF
jgi:hypothetical protein